MVRILKGFVWLLFLFVFTSCANRDGKAEPEKEETIQKEPASNEQPEKKGVSFSALSKSVYSIQTYDGERILEKGQGFAITSDKIAAPFHLFREATRAVLIPHDGSRSFEVTRYYNYDRTGNVIVLMAGKAELEPLTLFGGKKIQGIKTSVIAPKRGNTIPVHTGKCLQEKMVQGRELFSITNHILKSTEGAPVFVSNGTVLGMAASLEVMYQKEYFAVPALFLLDVLKKGKSDKPLSAIGNPDAQRNKAIKQIILETDKGNIAIKLYNEIPTYRDNFIQLAEEGYFDSLLIHRVIRDFGIQTGAADTRYAQSDDIVGWKGPGYTLPAHIVKGIYHKRGAIGSPRKPDTKNRKRRSDGSQFYIVTGRLYHDEELDEIEGENGITFSEEQRNTYKTIGGAPHLDGSYTVFGEVVSGLEIADEITMLPTKNDFRPLKDIRLKKIRIVF
ncbi:MAG: peptidylprolyl isomerase [Prolixibacteraceae bacterium]|nr:peptidylprolyl isomerase [Prolixibacteraceae bacterium]